MWRRNENDNNQCLAYKISGDFVGYDDRKNHPLLSENEVSGTGLGIVIRAFSNEMERGFSQAMECLRSFLSEMEGVEIADYLILDIGG